MDHLNIGPVYRVAQVEIEIGPFWGTYKWWNGGRLSHMLFCCLITICRSVNVFPMSWSGLFIRLELIATFTIY